MVISPAAGYYHSRLGCHWCGGGGVVSCGVVLWLVGVVWCGVVWWWGDLVLIAGLAVFNWGCTLREGFIRYFSGLLCYY